MNNKQKNQTKAEVASGAVSSEAVLRQTFEDFKNSVLVVSLLVNLFVLTSWLVIEVTDIYNLALITYLEK